LVTLFLEQPATMTIKANHKPNLAIEFIEVGKDNYFRAIYSVIKLAQYQCLVGLGQ